MNKARIIIGLVIVVVSMIYLTAYAIPNVFRAQEEVRQAEIDVAESEAELDAAIQEMNDSIDDILNEETIN